ncbi:MAG: lipocalin-like domain-containing protein [Rhizobacter sp.]|nr:lipocalin-like domain-containing protein [Chlorobiales bacterium]
MLDSIDVSALVREKLVGAWKLVSYAVRVLSGETLHPYSESPVGLLIYDASGMMSAQIMNPDRAKHEGPGKETANELRAAYNGYIAYFGKFSIEPSGEAVTHHVEGSLHTWILHTDQVRFLSVKNEQLVLSADLKSGLKTRRHEITWERVSTET